MFSVEPKRPICCNNYICDKIFHLDELDKLQANDGTEQKFGIALINGRTSEFYLVSDLQIRLLGIVTTTTMNHHRRGGSSSGRLARLRENKIDHNIAYIVDELEKHFKHVPLLIGGCAEVYQHVATELQDIVIDFFPWQGSGISSAQNLWEEKRDVAHDWIRKQEQKLLEPLWKMMNVAPELLLYGKEVDEKKCKIIYFNANEYTFNGIGCIPIFNSDTLDAFGGCIGVKKDETAIAIETE